MLKGTCNRCGATYVGWALRKEKHRVCKQCGGEIEVKEEGGEDANCK